MLRQPLTRLVPRGSVPSPAAALAAAPPASANGRRYSSTGQDGAVEISGITAADVQGARQYCTSLLRRYDSPSYTLRAFVPPHAQDAYTALRAFNVDVARIADSTSNSTVGALRMQFWRDAVARALALAPPKEPVAILLSVAAAGLAHHSGLDGVERRMSRSWLHRVIDTREAYLENPPMRDMAALERYAENTYSTLLYLTLSALPVASLAADHLASHIGKAQGIVAVLRGLPLLAFPAPQGTHANRQGLGGALGADAGRHGAVTLPLDVMAAAGLREEEVLRKGREAQGLRDAVFAVATRANDHLITAREMWRDLSAGRDVGHEFEHAEDVEFREGRAAGSAAAQRAEVERAFGVLMPAVSTQMWLDRLQGYDFDVFEPRLRVADWRLPFKAYWAYRRRRL